MTNDKCYKLNALQEEIRELSYITEKLNKKDTKVKLRLEILEYDKKSNLICDTYARINNILVKYIPTIQKDVETRLDEIKEIFEML